LGFVPSLPTISYDNPHIFGHLCQGVHRAILFWIEGHMRSKCNNPCEIRGVPVFWLRDIQDLTFRFPLAVAVQINTNGGLDKGLDSYPSLDRLQCYFLMKFFVNIDGFCYGLFHPAYILA